LLVLLALGTAALAAGRQAPGRRVLVGFRPDTGPRTAEARADVVRQRGGTVHRSLRLVSVVSATLAPEAIERLRAQSDIAYVEDDVVLYALGQTMAWGVDRIDADLAWPAGNTGKGVKVAILDTGIDPTHPDLGVAGGVNFAGSTKDGSTSPADWNDGHGHGTHCAGIVAARNNTIGVVGVAPDAILWAVKVLSDAGSGYTSDIIQGLDWCAANGVKVASMSLGGGGTASLQAACDRAFSQGVVLVAAAGNSAGPVMYPAAYSSVIAVSATDSRDLRASFSNYGPQIALAAPGVSIYSTYKGGSYAYMSGTSMACPHVAGAAALAWASGLTSSQAVRDRLTTTAEDLGTKGFDTSFGYGLVDAQKAAGGSGGGGGDTPPVDNPPTVGITAPAQGATVAQIVTVRATATDDHGVAQVEFLVDGVRIGVDSSGGDGWSASWDTTRAPDGQHTVAATATDTAGKTASSSVAVTVRNAAPAPTGKMSVSSITYSTSGANNADLNVTISVVSGAGTPMANAFVWANVYLNGRVCLTPIATTNAAGSASFKLVRASAGIYKTTMVRVSAAGQTWDGVTPPNEFAK
jgi:subtilisin